MLSENQLFDSGPVVLIRWQANSLCPITSASRNIQELLGITLEAHPPGEVCYGEFIHPDDRDRVYEKLEYNLAQGNDHFGRLDYRLITRDGKIKWVNDHTVVVRKTDGSIDHFMGYVIDITERKHIEDLHALNEVRFKAITEVMSDWTWEVNAKGIYTYCSGQVESFLGYRAEEVIGITPFDLMAKEDAMDLREYVSQIIDQRLPIVALENWNLSKDGRRVCLQTNAVPIYDSEGHFNGYRGVAKDITQRKHEDAMLLRAHDTAVEALRVKNEFMANMSHELRTPLNGISGALELIKDQTSDEGMLTLIHVAYDASQSLLRLINTLLKHSQLSLGMVEIKRKPLELKSFLHTLLEEARILAKQKPIEFSLHMADDVPDEIHTDSIWLRQVLYNLLSNAIKFTPAGNIKLELCRPDGDHLLYFHLSDTGIGIPVEHQHKVFDAFYQVESSSTRRFEGTGLGLAISKQIIQRMGGDIWLESNTDKGTRVSFNHPLSIA